MGYFVPVPMKRLRAALGAACNPIQHINNKVGHRATEKLTDAAYHIQVGSSEKVRF